MFTVWATAAMAMPTSTDPSATTLAMWHFVVACVQVQSRSDLGGLTINGCYLLNTCERHSPCVRQTHICSELSSNIL